MSRGADFYSREQRLDAAFTRINSLPSDNFELRADFARYLTVLVYGYLEQSVQQLLITYIAQSSPPPVARYAESQLERRRNIKANTLLQLLEEFDIEWRNACEDKLDERRRTAIDTVTNNRNQIAHGKSVGITFATINRDYQEIKQTVQDLRELLNPPSTRL